MRYVLNDQIAAPSVITLNAVAAASALNDYLLTTVGLTPAADQRRWARFRPTAPGATDRVESEQFRRDPTCGECSASGRLGAGRTRRLPTRPSP
jgi:hypothetical protein